MRCAPSRGSAARLAAAVPAFLAMALVMAEVFNRQDVVRVLKAAGARKVRPPRCSSSR